MVRRKAHQRSDIPKTDTSLRAKIVSVFLSIVTIIIFSIIITYKPAQAGVASYNGQQIMAEEVEKLTLKPCTPISIVEAIEIIEDNKRADENNLTITDEEIEAKAYEINESSSQVIADKFDKNIDDVKSYLKSLVIEDKLGVPEVHNITIY